jgi:hypothetical protein
VYEFLAALISFFLIQPLQTEMADRFGSISREQVTSVTTCIREATPVFIEQATDQPWQTATQVFGIWSGMTAPEEVLAQATPGCADTIRGLMAESSRQS